MIEMPSVRPFMERLHEAVHAKGAPVVVGLDPRPEWFPKDVFDDGGPAAAGAEEAERLRVARAIVRFNELILDAVRDVAVAVKPQLAFYERWGWAGIRALEETMKLAKARGLLVIADGKRNDIGSTAAAYAETYLGTPSAAGEWVSSGLEADALTVNPYLGTDGLQPFVAACARNGKGIFVLLRTSNASGAELQSLPTGVESVEAVGAGHEKPTTVADRVADMIITLNDGLPRADGYGPVGAVVGATHPEEARRLRQRLPGVMMLVPGYGAQGAGARDALAAVDGDGKGALINSARGILYAWRKERPGEAGTGADYAAAARRAVLAMRSELRGVLP